MLRNYFLAALRNLARNRSYASISIVALATGLCAALISGLLVRNQTSYDQFIPGYQQTYLVAWVLLPSGRSPLYNQRSPNLVAKALKLDFQDIQAVTRVADQDVRLRHGQIESPETIFWADPDAFEVLPFPTVAGNLRSALEQPDSIVLSRSAARKYFGREDPLGESITLNAAHPMTVTAVIEDLPVNGTQFGTQLSTGIFASGRSSYSLLSQLDGQQGRGLSLGGRTYLRLTPGGSIDRLRKAIPAFVKANYPTLPAGLGASLDLIRIDRVQLSEALNPGIRSKLTMAVILGLLILAISCVVFVNLSTARAARRALEVSIRKVLGASRSALIIQFLGESLLYVLLAACVAVALTELLIPPVNALLNSGATFNHWHDPVLLVWLGAGVLVIGILAGAYPAFVLTAFRPASVLKGLGAWNGGAKVRQALVALQFATLIGLVIAAAVVYQQRQYAAGDALRVNSDQMLIARASCKGSFATAVRALARVRGAFCSTDSLLSRAAFGNFHLRDGTLAAIDTVGTEFGALDLYGLKPLAGRFASHNGDDASAMLGRFIINESAARQFGFASPEAAVGQPLPLADGGLGLLPPGTPNEIVGVVPDFAIDAVNQKPRAAIYYTPLLSYGPGLRDYGLINIKLTGREIPETLQVIDRLWTATGGTGPLNRFFLNDYIQNLYIAMLRESQLFAILSVVAVLLACLGLIALASSSTEHRTREIGIRKAMGASRADILRMLLWQFAKPVLWANLLAWPVAAFLMHRWLQGFSNHVHLDPLIFSGASAAVLALALATVVGHALLVARAKPVTALRYE